MVYNMIILKKSIYKKADDNEYYSKYKAKIIKSIRYVCPNAPASYEAAVIITTGGPIGIIERYKKDIAFSNFLPKALPTNVALLPSLGYILPSFPNTNATGKIITAIKNHMINAAHPL
jgi:hypothetical protein